LIRLNWLIALLIALGGASCAGTQADRTIVVSPDGKTRFQLAPDDAGRLTFTVTSRDRWFIGHSPMFFTVDGTDIAEGAHVSGVDRYSVNETYPWYGVHSMAVNRCNGARFSVRHDKSNTDYSIEARAYDDGVAFRTVVPGRDDQMRTPDERTVFKPPGASTTWFHGLRGHYEGDYKEYGSIADVKAGEWAAPPLTFKLPDNAGYGCITEANLVNYSGMALEADGHGGFVVGLGHRQPVNHPYELRYSKEDIERLSHPAVITGTITTPWRVVLVGKDLNTLVNSDVIANLCPPPDKKLFPDGIKTAWIRPGRAVWRYLDNGPRTAREDPSLAALNPATAPTTPAATRPTTRPERAVTIEEIDHDWTDLAAQLGFEHNILEGFWRRWSNEQIRAVCDYGKQHHVGIWLWKHSKELRDPQARKQFFAMCRENGVTGAKIDFFDHEHMETVNLYVDILRDAAENGILCDFHGANKPTGISRTWPNELAVEAVHGMEASRVRERAFAETTLPFTRNLAGPMEYTPVHFGERRGDTTWAHQVTLPITFTCPMFTYAANPRNLLSSPAVEMFKSIPSVWDETIVLPPSEIGQCAVFARRSGERWFLAISNGPAAKKFEVPLSFLKSDGEHRALVVSEGDEGSASMKVENKTMRRGETITIDLPAGGGYVARFEK
jgi:alpha-glucosidase